jgi:hypothetical protein
MRTPTDAMRSMTRYLYQSLGEEWEVRFTDEEGVFERPFLALTSLPARRTAHGAFHGEMARTFSVVAYPIEKPTPDEAKVEAERVVELLHKAFGVGTHAPSFGRTNTYGPTQTIRRGHPWRVPLYDYSNVTLEEAATEGDRDPRDFMRVEEPPTFGALEGRARTDEEETLWVVTGEIRVKWSVGAGVVEDGTTTQSVIVGGSAD